MKLYILYLFSLTRVQRIVFDKNEKPFINLSITSLKLKIRLFICIAIYVIWNQNYVISDNKNDVFKMVIGFDIWKFVENTDRNEHIIIIYIIWVVCY